MNDIYLTDTQTGDRYQVSRPTIWRWARTKSTGFPSPIKLAENTTRWKLADLIEWENSQEAA